MVAEPNQPCIEETNKNDMGINIAELERQEAISFSMWLQSLNKTGFPKNVDGTMKDIWELYDYWDSMDGLDKKPFWTHARTKEPEAAALLSGEDWKEDGELKTKEQILGMARPITEEGMQDHDLNKLYEWTMDDRRMPAQTHFTAGVARNIAREIELRWSRRHEKWREGGESNSM